MAGNLDLVVLARRDLTSDITEFTLGSSDGTVLPDYEPGAHLSVRTPSDCWRSYSLCGEAEDRHRFRIAVKREPAGRGGSLSMHEALHPGDVLEARPPVNAFALKPAAAHLFIAGGIGITPILPMFEALLRRGADVRMVYLSRRRSDAAFLDRIDRLDASDRVTVHCSAEDGSGRYDLWPLFESPRDRHLYFCGSKALEEVIYLQTIHWPRSMVHSESFAGVDPTGGNAAPFSLRRLSTGETFSVAANTSILDVLRLHGIEWKSSCESGTCGTCCMRLVDGKPIHRDIVLTEEERLTRFMPCVSRGEETLTLEF